MPGFSVRIKDLPEDPDEKKIPLFRLLLPIGLLFFAMGIKSGFDYFHSHGPPISMLHELKMSDVTAITEEPEISDSSKIDRIWLTESDGVKIRYRARFPYSDEIRQQNTNFSLLLDATNAIWGLKEKGQGGILGRAYFEDYNIEAKSVDLVCGPFIGIFGAMILFAYFVSEHAFRRGKLPEEHQMLRPKRSVVFGATLAGYAILFWAAIVPILSPIVPSWVLGCIWVAGGGLLGNAVVIYYEKKSKR